MDKYPPCIRSKPKRLVFLIGPVDNEPDFHNSAIRFLNNSMNDSSQQKHEEVLYHFQSVPIDHSFPAKKPPKDMPSTDGILKYNWTRKHFEAIPSVLIYFTTFSVDWSAAEWNRRENMIQERYHRLKSIMSLRDIKIIVVLIRIGTTSLDKDVVEERLNILKKHIPTDHKTFYYLTMQDLFQIENPVTKRLFKSIKEYSHYYYINQIKHFKSMEKLVGDKYKGYLYNLLSARYQFKIAFLQEFVTSHYTAANTSSFASSPLGSLAAGMSNSNAGNSSFMASKEHNVALKYYQQAYHSLLTSLETIDASLYEQVQHVAEMVHMKILMLLLVQYQLFEESFTQFKLHIASFARSGSRMHSVPYQHAQWMSEQYVVFAELLQYSQAVPILLTPFTLATTAGNTLFPGIAHAGMIKWYEVAMNQALVAHVASVSDGQDALKKVFSGMSIFLLKNGQVTEHSMSGNQPSATASMSINTNVCVGYSYKRDGASLPPAPPLSQSGKLPSVASINTNTANVNYAKDLSFYYQNAARYLIQRDVLFATFLRQYTQKCEQQEMNEYRESSISIDSGSGLSTSLPRPSVAFPPSSNAPLPSLPGTGTLEEYLQKANLDGKIILPPKYVGSTVHFVDPLEEHDVSAGKEEDDEDNMVHSTYEYLYYSHLIQGEITAASQIITGAPSGSVGANGNVSMVHSYYHHMIIACLLLALQAIPSASTRRRTLLLMRLVEQYTHVSPTILVHTAAISGGRLGIDSTPADLGIHSHWEKVSSITKHCLEVYLSERWYTCTASIVPLLRDANHALLLPNSTPSSNMVKNVVEYGYDYLKTTIWLYVYYHTLQSIGSDGLAMPTTSSGLMERMETLYEQIAQMMNVSCDSSEENFAAVWDEIATHLPTPHGMIPMIFHPPLGDNIKRVTTDAMTKSPGKHNSIITAPGNENSGSSGIGGRAPSALTLAMYTTNTTLLTPPSSPSTPLLSKRALTLSTPAESSVLTMHNDAECMNSLFSVQYAFADTAMSLGHHLLFTLSIQWKGMETMQCRSVDLIFNDGYLSLSLQHDANKESTEQPSQLFFNQEGSSGVHELSTNLHFAGWEKKEWVIDMYLTESKFRSLLSPDTVLYLEQILVHHPQQVLPNTVVDEKANIPVIYQVYIQPLSFSQYFHHVQCSTNNTPPPTIGFTHNATAPPSTVNSAAVGTTTPVVAEVQGTVGGIQCLKPYTHIKSTQIDDYLHYTTLSLSTPPIPIPGVPHSSAVPSSSSSSTSQHLRARAHQYFHLTKPTDILKQQLPPPLLTTTAITPSKSTTSSASSKAIIRLFEGLCQRVNILFTVQDHDILPGSRLFVTLGEGENQEVENEVLVEIGMPILYHSPTASDNNNSASEEEEAKRISERGHHFPMMIPTTLLAHHSYILPIYLTPPPTTMTTSAFSSPGSTPVTTPSTPLSTASERAIQVRIGLQCTPKDIMISSLLTEFPLSCLISSPFQLRYTLSPTATSSVTTRSLYSTLPTPTCPTAVTKEDAVVTIVASEHVLDTIEIYRITLSSASSTSSTSSTVVDEGGEEVKEIALGTDTIVLKALEQFSQSLSLPTGDIRGNMVVTVHWRLIYPGELHLYPCHPLHTPSLSWYPTTSTTALSTCTTITGTGSNTSGKKSMWDNVISEEIKAHVHRLSQHPHFTSTLSTLLAPRQISYPLPPVQVTTISPLPFQVHVQYPRDPLRLGEAFTIHIHLCNTLPTVEKVLFVAYLNEHYLFCGNTLHMLEISGNTKEKLSIQLIPIRCGWLSFPRVSFSWQRGDGSTMSVYDTGEQERHRPKLFVQPHYPSPLR